MGTRLDQENVDDRLERLRAERLRRLRAERDRRRAESQPATGARPRTDARTGVRPRPSPKDEDGIEPTPGERAIVESMVEKALGFGRDVAGRVVENLPSPRELVDPLLHMEDYSPAARVGENIRQTLSSWAPGVGEHDPYAKPGAVRSPDVTPAQALEDVFTVGETVGGLRILPAVSGIARRAIGRGIRKPATVGKVLEPVERAASRLGASGGARRGVIDLKDISDQLAGTTGPLPRELQRQLLSRDGRDLLRQAFVDPKEYANVIRLIERGDSPGVRRALKIGSGGGLGALGFEAVRRLVGSIFE